MLAAHVPLQACLHAYSSSAQCWAPYSTHTSKQPGSCPCEACGRWLIPAAQVLEAAAALRRPACVAQHLGTLMCLTLVCFASVAYLRSPRMPLNRGSPPASSSCDLCKLHKLHVRYTHARANTAASAKTAARAARPGSSTGAALVRVSLNAMRYTTLAWSSATSIELSGRRSRPTGRPHASPLLSSSQPSANMECPTAVRPSGLSCTFATRYPSGGSRFQDLQMGVASGSCRAGRGWQVAAAKCLPSGGSRQG